MIQREVTSGYWGDEIASARERGNRSLWYDYMDRVYATLLADASEGPSLKTDLFEEARGGPAPLHRLSAPLYGIDLSADVAELARRRIEGEGLQASVIVADVRCLPFADGFFRFILSGSTLDHFDSEDEIFRSLRELARVLAPGGKLVLTLDNPHNPVVALRGRSPWIDRLRLDRYFVGATLTRGQGIEALHAAGFSVKAVKAVAHAPRDPVMRAMRLIERRPDTDRDRWLGRLMSLERLRDWPVALRTGYYLAFTATRNHPKATVRAARPAETVVR